MKKVMLFLLVFCGLNGTAQDLHYSHFMQAPLQRNPSEAGNFNGDLRVTALQRRQWSSVTTPYRSLSLGVDGNPAVLYPPIRGLGAGLQINHDRAGDADLTRLQVLFAVSYRLALNRDSLHFIRAGIQGGLLRHSINFNALTFDNQYNGDVFNPGGLTGEQFGDDQFSSPDLGMGIGWTGYFNGNMVDAGFQIAHLNRPDYEFLNNNGNGYPQLYQFTLSAATAGNDLVKWLPALSILRQDQNTEITGGTEVQFFLREKPVRAWAFSVAGFYRYRDAFIPQVALYYDKFRLGFSYDINTSGLKEASNYRGGAEFSLVYIVKKISARSKATTVCPVY